jgi:uncharacterized membrane protein (DUF2068 family)
MRDQAIDGHPEMTRRGESEAHAGSHPGGLLAIAIFKLAKSVFFFCVGLGLFHLLHRDLSDAAQKLATALHFEPEWRITALLTEKITLLDPKRLRDFGFFAFAYSAIALTEGVGLFLEKVWAEYLTLSLTLMFLPWELYELVRRPDYVRLGLLVINLLVLAYLLWILDRKKKISG